MPATAVIGWEGKVTVGADNTVVGMGNWNMTGIDTTKIDVSEFGDAFARYAYGRKEAGDITFSGIWDPTDTLGQEYLRYANNQNDALTTLKFWFNSTQYFEPCQTTGYFSPTTTTGADTRASYVHITAISITDDQADVARVDFTSSVSGVMVLVNAV